MTELNSSSADSFEVSGGSSGTSDRDEATSQVEAGVIVGPARRVAVLVAFALSGMSALMYEVVWTRQLSLVFGSTVYAVSTMLAAFMTGLSLGGFIGGKRADKKGVDHTRDYMIVELLIGVFGMLTIPLMRALPPLMYGLGDVAERSFTLFLVGQFAASFLIMLVPTTLMGATFPIVSRIVTTSFDKVGESVGGAYAINTLGSIVGSASAGFLFIPWLGVRGAVVVAIVVNVASALIVAATLQRKSIRTAAISGASILVLAGTMAGLLKSPVLEPSVLSASRYASYDEYKRDNAACTSLFDEEGVFGRVVVLEDGTGQRSLQNGPMIEGSTGEGDVYTTSLLATLPYAYASQMAEDGEMDKGLVIGLGTGFTARMMLDLPFKKVQTIEINPSVLEASRFFVGDRLESDSRWQVTLADARWVIAVSDERFDVITSEPSWPVASAVTPLFTKESYENTRERLSDDGVFVQWLPMYLLKESEFQMMYRTFAQVFPNNAVWVSGNDALLIGTPFEGELPSSESVIAVVQDELGETADLRPFTNSKLLADALRSDEPINTDDHPILETAIARNVVEQMSASRSAAGGFNQ